MIKQFRSPIHLKNDLSISYMERAIEFSRLLGFQTETATFPVTADDEGIDVPETYAGFSSFYRKEEELILPEDYVASSDSARPIMDFDWRKKRGLEALFEKGAFLPDENLDQLPDSMNFRIYLENPRRFLLEAACNLAFRFGMETTAYDGLLLTDTPDDTGNLIVLREDDRCEVRLEENGEYQRVIISGNDESLVPFISRICMTFPKLGAFDTWSDRLQEIGEGMRMNTLDGQLAYLRAYANDSADEITAYVDPDIDGRRGEIEAAFPKVEFVNYKTEQLVYEKDYAFPWEVDEMKDLLKEVFIPNINEYKKFKLQVAVSEDKEVRSAIQEELKETLPGNVDIEVLCSYKQGYSWLDEVVIPNLEDRAKEGCAASRVTIAFRPFLKPGQTDWLDEDGATPSYNNISGKDNADRWYDLPIRYLQELYPIEDQFVKRLGLHPDNVEFVEYKGDEDVTYEVTATSDSGYVLYEDTYRAECAERPFLDAYPEMGMVHPSTGYIKLYDETGLLQQERVVTDVEKIWDTYQSEILPDIRSYVDEKTGGVDLVNQQPFFNKMEINVETSEPNERLDSREDIFSTLDGLHEDMYFVGTDYFKNYGMEKVGQITDAPGLILPKIRKVSGKGASIHVAVYSQQADHPSICAGNQRIEAEADYEDINVWVKSLAMEEGKLTAHVAIEGVSDALPEAYAELIQLKVLSISTEFSGVDRVVLESAGNLYRADVYRPEMPEKTGSIEEIDISENELIGYEKYVEIIQKLKTVPGIDVYRTAKSYKGREIYVVELKPDREGYVSRTKRITNYPTEMITSRHHANEVSSTNSAFMLIRELLTNDKYKDLTEKMNFVISPMENVDGSAIHYELQKDNPNWKLHVARFNSLGKEFYYDHFTKHTIHTEAMSLRRLFMRMLPDVIVDNHGVPSHEWEQQFSGYTSPSYKGFWLPRSLLYGYFYTIDGDEYKSNVSLCHKMEDVIADAFLDDEEITRENLMWARQFEKYAHNWMPRLFPANYYKNMITYWIPHIYDPEHRYPSVRYPWILSVDYVSEVADETAQGEYLHSCARAHLMHDLAIIDMLMNCRATYETSCDVGSGKVEHTRKRPVIVS